MKPHIFVVGMISISTSAWSSEMKGKCSLEVKGRTANIILEYPDDLITLFNQKAKKGLPVTIENSIESKQGFATIQVEKFACKSTYDPWDKVFTVKVLSSINKVTKSINLNSDPLLKGGPCSIFNFDLESFDNPRKIQIVSKIDPVDSIQIEKTRIWLSERGVAKNGPSLFGRAISSLIDLKGETSRTIECEAGTN